MNYCCSSIRVASIVENKNTPIERLPWHTLQPLVQTASPFVRVKKSASCWGWSLSIWQINYRAQTKTKITKILQIVIFNVRTLNRIGNLQERTALAIDHSIDTICIQEHGYVHSEDIKHHNTKKLWRLFSASTCKNSVNAPIGSMGMHVGMRALKCLNRIWKIQPRMIVATFKGNPSATIISCNRPIHVSEETDVITFYTKLSSLVCSIIKHNVLVTGWDMNAQTVKNLSQKFSPLNSSSRNGEYLTDF